MTNRKGNRMTEYILCDKHGKEIDRYEQKLKAVYESWVKYQMEFATIITEDNGKYIDTDVVRNGKLW